MFEALKNKLQVKEEQKKEGNSLAGMLLVPDSVQETRYNTCLNCDKFYSLLKTCQLCHCVMPLKTKLAMASCPIKKWDKYNQ